MLRGKSFRESDLRKVGDAYPWPSPPGFGAAVRLNSGGPRMLIVDVDGDQRRCSWPAEGRWNGGEMTISWRCLKPA